MLTSPGINEGKTSTLANLGVVFAQAGERVVLVSGDLRRPRIGDFFGIDEQVGLTSVLLGQQTLEQTLVSVPGFGQLTLLPAGPIPPNPAELLNSARLQEILTRLRHHYDLVLIDSPPILPVTDPAILARHADAILILAAAGQTGRADLHRAAEKLDQAGAKVLGIVLNKVTKHTERNYGYTYSYQPYKTTTPPALQPAHTNGTSKTHHRNRG
jgi:capsular exopolysaccharide synthesis family protein